MSTEAEKAINDLETYVDSGGMLTATLCGGSEPSGDRLLIVERSDRRALSAMEEQCAACGLLCALAEAYPEQAAKVFACLARSRS